MDVNDRDDQGQAFDVCVSRHLRLAIDGEGYVEARSAHVNPDRVVVVDVPGEVRRRDRAAHWSGEECAYGLRPGSRGGCDATIRLHHMDRYRSLCIAQSRL